MGRGFSLRLEIVSIPQSGFIACKDSDRMSLPLRLLRFFLTIFLRLSMALVPLCSLFFIPFFVTLYSSMKVVLLNGSPHRQGKVAQLLMAMQEEAERQGMQTRLIQVSDLKVQPCCGCMQCRSLRRCVLPVDDAQQVLQALKEADALVIGAPCYWANMPGSLKVLFDRLVYGLMDDSAGRLPRPLHRGKRALLVVTASTPYPFNFLFDQTSGTLRSLRAVLKWSGFRVVGQLVRSGTKAHPQLRERDLAAARQIVGRLKRRFVWF